MKFNLTFWASTYDVTSPAFFVGIFPTKKNTRSKILLAFNFAGFLGCVRE